MDFDYILGYVLGLGSMFFTAQPLLRALTQSANQDAPNAVLDVGSALESWRRGTLSEADLAADLGAAGLNAARIGVLQLLQTTLLPAGDALNALYRGNLSTADFNTQMQQLGFSAASTALMISNFEARLNPGDLFEAEHRNLAIPSSVGDTEKELYATGYTADRVALLRQLALKIPQLADLINFSAWSVDDTSFVEKYGLNDGMPADWITNMAALGIPQTLATKLWQSHWQPVPLFMLKTLYETGQIPESDLAAFLNIYQIPPAFQAGIIAAFSKQLSEAQILEAVQNGTITEAQLDPLISANGYAPATVPIVHALIMAKAALPSAEQKYALAQQKAQFKSLSVGTVMSSYEEGIITSDEVTTYLTDLQIEPDIITFQINHSNWKIAKAQLNDNITAIGDSFMLGQIDQPTALGQLSALGVNAAKQTNLIYKWTKAIPVKTKSLSEADLSKAFKSQLIDITTFNARLLALGYSAGDAAILIALEGAVSLAQVQSDLLLDSTSAPLPSPNPNA